MTAYINRIATATPAHDVHQAFVTFATEQLADAPQAPLFKRLVQRSGIEHRWSVLQPEKAGALQMSSFYRRGGFPSTAGRMAVYERTAPDLASRAVAGLELDDPQAVTHLIVTSCTGFYAPGLDLQLIDLCGLDPSVERTLIGFMGCYAAINALKLAHHIVRSEPAAQVLIVSLELCTLHLQDTVDLEPMLSFLIFGDGCAAALVSGRAEGLAIESFKAVRAPRTAELITWTVGDNGFDMMLSGRVPAAIGAALRAEGGAILGGAEAHGIGHWAVHPGGRSVLDAVEQALALPPEALAPSREVLRAFGNMSSATVLFVLARVLEQARAGERGCAMSFGPGLTAETMLFRGTA